MIYKVGVSGLGASSVLSMNTSQLASFATSTAGGITAASLALVGLGPIGAFIAIGTQLASLLISQLSS
jgi:hypothetical protein